MDNIVRTTKRRVTEEQWKGIILDCQSTGMSVKDYCELHHLCKSTYFKWQRVLRLNICKSNLPAASNGTLVKLDFEKNQLPVYSIDKGRNSIAVNIGITKIDIPQGADPATIKAVLAAVAELCC